MGLPIWNFSDDKKADRPVKDTVKHDPTAAARSSIRRVADRTSMSTGSRRGNARSDPTSTSTISSRFHRVHPDAQAEAVAVASTSTSASASASASASSSSSQAPRIHLRADGPSSPPAPEPERSQQQTGAHQSTTTTTATTTATAPSDSVRLGFRSHSTTSPPPPSSAQDSAQAHVRTQPLQRQSRRPHFRPRPASTQGTGLAATLRRRNLSTTFVPPALERSRPQSRDGTAPRATLPTPPLDLSRLPTPIDFIRRTYRHNPLPRPLSTLADGPASPPVNGLGDRRRSISPTNDAWDVMHSTITPDETLPSTSASFASAAASASFNTTLTHPDDPSEQPSSTTTAMRAWAEMNVDVSFDETMREMGITVSDSEAQSVSTPSDVSVNSWNPQTANVNPDADAASDSDSDSLSSDSSSNATRLSPPPSPPMSPRSASARDGDSASDEDVDTDEAQHVAQRQAVGQRLYDLLMATTQGRQQISAIRNGTYHPDDLPYQLAPRSEARASATQTQPDVLAIDNEESLATPISHSGSNPIEDAVAEPSQVPDEFSQAMRQRIEQAAFRTNAFMDSTERERQPQMEFDEPLSSDRTTRNADEVARLLAEINDNITFASSQTTNVDELRGMLSVISGLGARVLYTSDQLIRSIADNEEQFTVAGSHLAISDAVDAARARYERDELRARISRRRLHRRQRRELRSIDAATREQAGGAPLSHEEIVRRGRLVTRRLGERPSDLTRNQASERLMELDRLREDNMRFQRRLLMERDIGAAREHDLFRRRNGS